ncbi:MAG TPA: hypothetical protein VL977_00295 [Solirubrobacteraceae bacterium]|nr:hypothetical protein [Solirubrobacteraceae bacterium]
MSPRQSAAARVQPLPQRPEPLRPPAPRRVSGPARRPRAAPRAAARRATIVRLLDAPFLDRLLRGRLWIALVAVALLGIVAMQVAILRLGASIGADTEQVQRLTAANQAAATVIARDEPGGDVAAQATRLGMLYPPPDDVRYLSYRPGVAAAAASSYTPATAPATTPAAATLTEPLAPVASDTTAPDATDVTPASSAPAASATETATSDTTTSQGGTAQPATTTVGAGGGASAPPG